MNKYVLMAMDSVANPGKYTVEQLIKNRDDAYDSDDDYDDDVACVAADYSALSCDYEHWLNIYFDESGENKQDYIDAINEGVSI